MLRATIILFVLALVAAALGFGGIAATAASTARLFFYGFLILAVVSLVTGVSKR